MTTIGFIISAIVFYYLGDQLLGNIETRKAEKRRFIYKRYIRS